MARPAEPTSLGRFLAYPSGVSWSVAPFWLASSPGSGHRVRMNAACKRAFLATIEAILERAVIPANCGTYPPNGVDFKTVQLDATYADALINLYPWNGTTYRAGIGAKLARGMPKDEWEHIVRFAAALWASPSKDIPCGTVYAWQTSMLDYNTAGWIDSAFSEPTCSDVSFCVADDSYALGGPILLRLWGDYPGTAGGYPIAEWVADTLNALGAPVFSPSMTPSGFADYNLNGSPAPLQSGNMGNWFGSTSGAMIGSQSDAITARRSSAAWAVLQAMLANMYITHLAFPYSWWLNTVIVRRIVTRYVSMDEDGTVVVEEDVNGTFSESGMGNSAVGAYSWMNLDSGLPTIQCVFFCLDEEAEALAVTTRPQDGWRTIGSALQPYLSFGSVTPGAATIEMAYEMTTGISSVDAANGYAYPAPGCREYVDAYGGVTFVDCEAFTSSAQNEQDYTRWCVMQETGGYDLSNPVRDHLSRLLNRIPAWPFPSVAACPATLSGDTSTFWNGWEVYYPDAPNIQVNGQSAYFPTRFRNVTFGTSGYIPISHDDADRAWKSSAQYEVIFANAQHAFPDWDSLSYPDRTFWITNTGTAMAAHAWNFKAMPKQ